MISKGRILEIKRVEVQRAYGGIKGGRGYGRTPFGYYNGYGAFCEYPEICLILVARIYQTNEVANINIKSIVQGKRLTRKFIAELNSMNRGREIAFIGEYGNWKLQNSGDVNR